MRKYNWKKILINTAWAIAGVGAIVLLGAAVQKKGQKICTEVRIEITGVERHMFIDEKDVLEILHATGKVEGAATSALDLRGMERVVEKNAWVKNADMFLDNNQVLQVRIEERQPVARVFTLGGNSFYLDSGSLRLPLSEKVSARVPSFTGFPSDKNILAKPDSLLLHHIVELGKYIMADSFWMAQVAQIDITAERNFEMIPVVGNHTVLFGEGENMEQKFHRLFVFYKNVLSQTGFDKYKAINVQYAGQVIGIKNSGGSKADTAQLRLNVEKLLKQAREMQNDSLMALRELKEQRTIN